MKYRPPQEISNYLGLNTGRRRRILPNPTAGDVRSREYLYGPWMERTNRRIEDENLKAEGVIFEKRVFDLAKQAVAALQGETETYHIVMLFLFWVA